MNIFRLLKKNRLFENFEDKDINKMFDCLKGRIVKYQKGIVIANQGDKITEIGILLEGYLAKFIQKPNKTKELIGDIQQGGMFGETEGYLKEKILPYSVLSAEDSTVLYITISTIVCQCENNCPCHHLLLDNTMQCLAERIHSQKRDKEYLTIKSMRLKIAKLVYEAYINQKSTDVSLGMNRNEMAEYLNVSRPSMSREMMRMRDEGIFDFRKDKIKIKKVKALEKIIKEA